jgi:hypothetical protein
VSRIIYWSLYTVDPHELRSAGRFTLLPITPTTYHLTTPPPTSFANPSSPTLSKSTSPSNTTPNRFFPSLSSISSLNLQNLFPSPIASIHTTVAALVVVASDFPGGHVGLECVRKACRCRACAEMRKRGLKDKAHALSRYMPGSSMVQFMRATWLTLVRLVGGSEGMERDVGKGAKCTHMYCRRGDQLQQVCVRRRRCALSRR